MESYKAVILGMMISMSCSIAVADNNDHAAPRLTDQPMDSHMAAEKSANADKPGKTIQKKKTTKASKKAVVSKEDDAHAAAPAATPVIVKRVQVRDRTALAKAVNVIYPPINPSAAAMSDADSHNAHGADLSVVPANEVIIQLVEVPKADQSSYSSIERHPAAYMRPATGVTDHATETVRPTNMDSVQLSDASVVHAEPVRQAAESSNTCTPPSKADIAALFDRWNKSLRTGDPKKVVANYAPYSVLLPTVSNKARFTAAEKEEYFQHFLERKPEGKIDDRLIEVDCRSASDAGLYTFSFQDGSVVKARYSFSYKKVGDEWLISSHHSSGMPEKPALAAKLAENEKPVVKTAEHHSNHAAREDVRNEAPSRSQGWVRYP